MKCRSCNKQIADDMSFCGYCGAPVTPAEMAQSPPVSELNKSKVRIISSTPVKKRNTKRIIKLAGAFAALITAAAVAVVCFFLDNGAEFKSGILQRQVSMDGTKAFVLTNNNDLYYTCGETKKHISKYVEDFIIADTGEAVLFYTNVFYSNNASGREDFFPWWADLKLYTVESGLLETIDSKVILYPPGLCLSPDGKTAAYVSTGNPDNNFRNGCDSYISNNRIGKAIIGIIIGVSDDAKYIYYETWYDNNVINSREMQFNVIYNNETVNLGTSSGGTSSDMPRFLSNLDSYVFNSDYSQILFSYDGITYISKNGGERIKVMDAPFIKLMLPQGTQARIEQTARQCRAVVDVLDFTETFISECLVYEPANVSSIQQEPISEATGDRTYTNWYRVELAPDRYKAELAKDGIRLSWQIVTDVPCTFRLYRSEQSGIRGVMILEDELYIGDYIDRSIETGKTYFYSLCIYPNDNALRWDKDEPMQISSDMQKKVEFSSSTK